MRGGRGVTAGAEHQELIQHPLFLLSPGLSQSPGGQNNRGEGCKDQRLGHLEA